MCGIIGYVGRKRSCPSSSTGCGGSNIAATTRPASPSSSDGAIELRRSAGKLLEPRGGASRHEPLDGEYGIGHTRWATHGRPTEENAHPHRDCTGRIVVVHNGIIENYLELKRQLQKRRAQVRDRDGHRGRGAPGRARDAGTTASRTPCGGRCGAARALRARADLGRRSRARSSPSATARRSSSASARTRTSSPPTSRRSSATRATSSSSTTTRWRSSRRRRRVHRHSGRAVSKKSTRVSLGSGDGREGRLPALHAQGDPRAAARRARHRARPRRRSRPAQVFLHEIEIPDEALRGGRARRHPGLRHVVARGAGRQVPDRGAGAHPGRSGLRLGVPLPQSDRVDEHAGDRHHAVGRDGRHARRAAGGQDEGRAKHRDLQRRRQHGDARGGRHGLHARRARRSAWPRPRPSPRSSSRCTCSRCDLGAASRHADAGRGAPALDALHAAPAT